MIGRDVKFKEQKTHSGIAVTTGTIIDSILISHRNASATYYVVCANETEIIMVYPPEIEGFETKRRQIPIKGGSQLIKFSIPSMPIFDSLDDERCIAIAETGFSYYCENGKVVHKKNCQYDIAWLESQTETPSMITLSITEGRITEDYLLSRGYTQRAGDGSNNKTCIRICPGKKWFWYGNYSILPSVMEYFEY